MGPTAILVFIIFIDVDRATRNGVVCLPAHVRTSMYRPFHTILGGTTIITSTSY